MRRGETANVLARCNFRTPLERWEGVGVSNRGGERVGSGGWEKLWLTPAGEERRWSRVELGSP